ncbi:MAG TPA: DUF3857 and transglutaminase domain-containing protein [Thermoanaerobaculia bacterium]|nr:DUF3857 and transglutaminase domain-containing protein [Thermoanaerobaculia bacterium]
MILPRKKLLLAPLLLALALGAVLPFRAAAAGFPEITAEERALTSVPNQPNAPAVVLFKKGEFSMAGVLGNNDASILSVRIRRKILTDEGKRYGEVAVHHSKWARLQNLKARTVLPDNRVVPVAKEAIFRRKTSETGNTFVTAIAFPAVEVGAILDYSYEIRIDSIFFLEPWYFQEDVPTLYSEMVCEMPEGIVTSSWRRDPMKVGIEQEVKQTVSGILVKVWGKNLPAVPSEPYSLPFADLASSFMLIPTAIQDGYGGVTKLFKDWASTCDIFGKAYDKALRKSKAADARARELAKAGGGLREQAKAIHRFVRDEIETKDVPGVALAEGANVDAVLAARQGDYAEKALLLQAMLGAVGIKAQPVWVADRSGGAVDMQLASPWWFDSLVVAAEIDGQRVYLDPSDRTLAFGNLAPGLEGTPALLYDRKKPQPVILPTTRFEDHQRRAKVELGLDGEGRLAGRGTLELTGFHAWLRLDPQQEAAKVAESWKTWLGNAFEGYDVSDVQVKQEVDGQRLEVAWAMTQQEDEVLGDEVTLRPSLPFGPVQQPFTASRRLSPVLLAFADRDELELTLRWPEGWKPEALPKPLAHEGSVTEIAASVEVDEAARTLKYRRRMDIEQKFLQESRQYEEIQNLYTLTERHDAQGLVLVRR